MIRRDKKKKNCKGHEKNKSSNDSAPPSPFSFTEEFME
jgi:hypothetical protein